MKHRYFFPGIPDLLETKSLTRRDFIKLSVLVSGGLGLWISGCSPEPNNDSSLAAVDEWVSTLNNEDVSGFEKLLSETVLMARNNRRDTSSGRDNAWQLFSVSTGNQLEKIITFGQGESVCLIANATKFDRSLCYVFNFAGGLIDKVYEYSSGRFDLASSPHFSGIEMTQDETDLRAQIEIMDNIFVHGLNNRDFSTPGLSESIIFFLPPVSEPIIGKEEVGKDGKSYVQLFPNVSHKLIESFGEENLVCTHLIAEKAGKGSLCFVAVFEDQKIKELYEFWSDARVQV